jgi:hypothetical protein
MDSTSQTSADDEKIKSDLFNLVENLQIELQKKDEELQNQDKELQKKDEELQKKDQELQKKDEELQEKEEELARKHQVSKWLTTLCMSMRRFLGICRPFDCDNCSRKKSQCSYDGVRQKNTANQSCSLVS